ncbi:MAG: EAL domain-containing protein, partial [Epsilonproteobacteria bacterium]|nr:EAL domain-containing protein [Campylobacterota bacterium]
PFEFIDHLKRAGLINEITKQIIDKSFHYAKNHSLSINITSLDLMDDKFLIFLEEETKKYEVPFHNITLEILEDISLNSSAHILSNLKKLKELGYMLAFDDFGTGLSNFERLMDVEPDYIKIDGKFIKDIHTNQNSYNITKTMVKVAKDCNAEVIAEFVENKEIVDILLDLGIYYGQGYYFSKPISKIEDVVIPKK